jgi:hypothetical protein
MPKVTYRELTPDDPIFRSGPEIFVPVSRRSTASSTPSTDGDQPQSSPPDEGDLSMHRRFEQALSALLASTEPELPEPPASPESTSPASPGPASSGNPQPDA